MKEFFFNITQQGLTKIGKLAKQQKNQRANGMKNKILKQIPLQRFNSRGSDWLH